MKKKISKFFLLSVKYNFCFFTIQLLRVSHMVIVIIYIAKTLIALVLLYLYKLCKSMDFFLNAIAT